MNELKQIDDLQADIDRLHLSEEGRLALGLADAGCVQRSRWAFVDRIRSSSHVWVQKCRGLGWHLTLLLDLHTSLLLHDILFKAISLVFLNLPIYDTFRELAKRDHGGQPRVFDL